MNNTSEPTIGAPINTRPWVTALRVIVGILSAVVGVGIVVLTAALGHCSAFGGACPGNPGLDWDVFRGVAVGAALAVGVPLFVRRPTRRRFITSAFAALIAGVLIGLAIAG